MVRCKSALVTSHTILSGALLQTKTVDFPRDSAFFHQVFYWRPSPSTVAIQELQT